jgi:hypothetical protein
VLHRVHGDRSLAEVRFPLAGRTAHHAFDDLEWFIVSAVLTGASDFFGFAITGSTDRTGIACLQLVSASTVDPDFAVRREIDIPALGTCRHLGEPPTTTMQLCSATGTTDDMQGESHDRICTG